MKKGINVWSFQKNSLDEVFALAKEAGFDGVEVELNETGEINYNSTESELKMVAEKARSYGLELYSLVCGQCWTHLLSDEDPEERAKAKAMVKRQLEVASILGCQSILVIPGCVNAEFAAPGKVMDYLTCYENSLQSLMELKKYAEEYKVEIGLENVWNKFLLSPVEMRDFIDKIESPYVGSYLDIGNTMANGYPEHWIRALGDRIKKVHFKDYRVAAGGLHGFVDILAGDVNYPAVMNALQEVGYDGWVTAEMIPSYTHYPDTIIYNTSNAMDRILGRK
jgi:hexulose-6-phosphate isomerase